MVQIPTGMVPVVTLIGTQQAMVTLSARLLGGQRMGLTTSMSVGSGRMVFATTMVTADRMHACARASATFLILLFGVLGIHSLLLCLLRSWKITLLTQLCAATVLYSSSPASQLRPCCLRRSATDRIALLLLK